MVKWCQLNKRGSLSQITRWSMLRTPLERNPARLGRTVLLCTLTYDHTGQGETAEVDIWSRTMSKIQETECCAQPFLGNSQIGRDWKYCKPKQETPKKIKNDQKQQLEQIQHKSDTLVVREFRNWDRSVTKVDRHIADEGQDSQGCIKEKCCMYSLQLYRGFDSYSASIVLWIIFKQNYVLSAA